MANSFFVRFLNSKSQNGINITHQRMMKKSHQRMMNVSIISGELVLFVYVVVEVQSYYPTVTTLQSSLLHWPNVTQHLST